MNRKWNNSSQGNKTSLKTHDEINSENDRGRGCITRRGRSQDGRNTFGNGGRSASLDMSKQVPSAQEEGKDNNKNIVLDIDQLKLLDETVTEDFVGQIIQDESGFPQALNNSALFTNVEIFEIILSVILKSIEFNKRPNESVLLLSKVKSSTFFAKGFVNYYLKIMTNLSQLNTNKVVDAFYTSVKLLQIIMERFPSTLETIITLYSMIKLIMNENDIVNDKLRNAVGDLSILVENEKRRHHHVIQRQGTIKTFPPPPNNFRVMGIFPNYDAELNQIKEPYLRPIVISGGFQDVEHYLDVHFRLLREDFVGPLRDGIREYTDNLKYGKSNFKLTDLKIYRGVQLIKEERLKNGSIFWIKFDSNKLKHVNWQTSKRFIHGSMLLLSNDDFKSAKMATVDNCGAENLSKGKVGVKFENPLLIRRLIGSNSFVMLESSALFEAYKHVIECFTTIDPTHFPFKEAIVFCQPVGNPPKYLDDPNARLFLLTNTRDMITAKPFNVKQRGGESFLPVIRSNLNRDEDDDSRSYIDVLDENVWPSADVLGLDESQRKALRHCLTSDLSIIQGPPGTGKTFLGLKLIEILLTNWNRWNAERKPILVVCYTNHALDQFLEGIHNFLKNGIVRVGGRSKSEVLKQSYLNEMRRNNRNVPRDIMNCKYELQNEMTNLISQIKFDEALLHNLTMGTINDKYLQDVMTARQRHSLLSIEPIHGSSRILHWLQISTTGSSSLSLNISIDVRLSYDQWSMVENCVSVGVKQIYPEEPKEMELVLDVKEAIRRKLADCGSMGDAEAKSVSDVTTLNIENRWRLYNHWLDKFRKNLKEKISEDAQNYNVRSVDLKTAYSNVDECIMKESKIIGMTTTCAARYRSVLERVQPKVIIVEEAAEVLESHLIASINSECQHLILIGDHMQLRPSVNVYRLETKYNLNVSLFERLILNDFPYVTLEKQHRMRSEIGDFARITYPVLTDDESLLEVENIKGVSSNIFFVNHNQLEAQDDELKSPSNTHEAAFLVRFCKYLNRQGYSYSKITILTPYMGQMFEIRKRIPKNILQDVRVCPVDNYQGEENDIILLSLVRSNCVEKIGFLKEFNRLNVALTRAKKGLFVIGNFDMLKNKSDFVKRIYELANEKEPSVYGTSLSLYCQNHPLTSISVSTANDFDLVPEGGCSLPCRFRLTCGHTCTRMCHPDDQNHSEFKCLKPCLQTFETCGHQCKKLCCEDCICEILVMKTLPKCQHQLMTKCHVDPKEIICPKKCLYVLPCSHPCKRICGQDHTDRCQVVVLKSFPCGHENNLPCFEATDETTVCVVKCVDILACGHPCNGTCEKCLNGKQHILCKQKCKRILPCQHRCTKMCSDSCGECELMVIKMVPKCEHMQKMKCHISPDDFKCLADCFYDLPCGHTCAERCGSAHTSRCKSPTAKVLDCGHKIMVECYKYKVNVYCRSLCDKILDCGHLCEGKCFDCQRERNHLPCQMKCERIMECGNHRCMKLCHEDCGKCRVLVTKILPRCGHNQKMPCHVSPESFICLEKGSVTLPCGHDCAETCGARHTVQCKVIVKKVLDCGHEIMVECYKFNENVSCRSLCDKILNCGHFCKGKCVDCQGGKNHVPCQRKCERIMECGEHRCANLCHEKCGECRVLVAKILPRCGHNQKMPCHVSPKSFICLERCSVTLPCGHDCAETCGASHTVHCKVIEILKCGHVNKLHCFRREEVSMDVLYRLKSGKVLKCGHARSEDCSTCRVKGVHAHCNEQCNKILICGHRCTGLCSDDCPPCRSPCEVVCRHRRCKKKCSEPCLPCTENCSWNCKHHKCSRPCHEECDRLRCDFPCEERLDCGHPCLGLCGERCPSLCRVCHPEKVNELIRDRARVRSARFVRMTGGCHHIIEVKEMDRWVDVCLQGDNSSTRANVPVPLSCPKCGARITNVRRYRPEIRRIRKEIEKLFSSNLFVII